MFTRQSAAGVSASSLFAEDMGKVTVPKRPKRNTIRGDLKRRCKVLPMISANTLRQDI